MRHHQQRRAQLVVESLQQHQDARAGLGVEVAGRLVGDDQRRVGDDRPRDADALLLSAGELPRIVVGPVGQADGLKRDLDRRRRSLRLSGNSNSGSSTFSYAVSTGIRLCIWKM